MKRAISVLLILTMLVASVLVAIPVSAATSGTAINSADEFLNMKNSGTYYLASDITISKTYSGTFMGVLDGNGKTVTLSGEAKSAIYMISGGIVKDLKIAGTVNIGKDYITVSHGALTANASNCTIDNVDSSVKFTVDAGDDKAIFTGSGIGGIIGVAGDKVTLKNCDNSGNIEVKTKATQLADPTDTSGESVGVFGLGGIVGNIYTSNWGTFTIDNCTNSGNLSSLQTKTQMGGIVGQVYSTSGIIRKSSNSGSITFEQVTRPNAYAYHGIAGIVGSTRFNGDKDATSSLVIYGCNNSGAVLSKDVEGTANVWTGGIAGRISATPNITISTSTNSGTITNYTDSGWSAAGGVVGTFMDLGMEWTQTTIGDIKVLNCVNESAGAVTAKRNAGGILGMGVQLANNGIKFNVAGCENKAAITSTYGGEAGGIIGALGYSGNDKMANGSIKNCKNTGAVNTNGTHAGGILAYFGSMGDGAFVIESCANSGAISAKTSGGIKGGIAGKLTAGSKCSVTNCASSQNGILGAAGATESGSSTTVPASITKAIDTTDIDYLVSSSNSLNQVNYTSYTWSTLVNAISTANNAKTSNNQSNINSAATALEAAINGLELVTVDNSALAELIDQAKDVEENEGYYDFTTYVDVINAMRAAERVLGSPYKSDLDAAEEALSLALTNLKFAPEADTVDYSDLEEAIAKAETLKQGDYTASSWNNLQDALEEAIEALDYDRQIYVDSAAISLNDAIDSLEPLDVDYSGLEALIEIAKGKSEGEYSVETYAVLKSEIANAEFALSSNVQSIVNDAHARLQAAISGLISVSVNTEKLVKLMADAGKLVQNMYTEESWKEFKKNLDEAYAIVDGGNLTQKTVDDLEKKLQAAIDSLVLKEDAESESESIETEPLMVVEGGCSSSVVGASATALVSVLLLGFAFKKKED